MTDLIRKILIGIDMAAVLVMLVGIYQIMKQKHDDRKKAEEDWWRKNGSENP